MMSALAIILTAAMIGPGDGPEKVSGEVKQGLDLSKEWEGTVRSEQGEMGRVRIDRRVIVIEWARGSVGLPTSNIIDEGGGKLLFVGKRGLYRQVDDSLVICIGDVSRKPLSIGAVQGHLIVLRRVKSRK